MPEIVQEIGAYAGLAAVAGLAVLSVLYFSQARDVKRLREWAGRAPERSAEPGVPQTVVPGRVQAQPQPKPAQQPQPAPQPQQAPRPGVPAVPAAAGAGAAAATQAKPAQAGGNAGAAAPGVPAQAGAQAATQAPARPGAPAVPQPGAKPGGPGSPATPGGPPAPVGPATPGAKPGGPKPGGPSAPGGPGGPATPAGGRPPGAPPVPPVPPGLRAPVRPMLPPRPMPQQTAVIPPPRRPWYRRVLASPRYLVLAVAGLLILGGAGAFGVTQLSSDDSGTPAGERPAPGGNGDGGKSGSGGGKRKRAIVPGNVTVAVLNGTTVPGLAKQVGDEVEARGFRLGTVANTPDQEQQRAESVVLYAPGHEREAKAVNSRLGIGQRERIDPGSQELAGDATVVVIAGADLAQ